jgi:hypothetical protein
MKDAFGIVQDCGNGEWQWVQPGKFRLAVGGPGSLTYTDRATAERDAEKMRARYHGDITVVAAAPATDEDKKDRFFALFEGHLEKLIWEGVNAFNRQEVSRGAPPATCDEVIKALANAVRYTLLYLSCPDDGYSEADENDSTESANVVHLAMRVEKVDHGDEHDLGERFVEELREAPSARRRDIDEIEHEVASLGR